MAIRVGGITVVDDSRNTSNIQALSAATVTANTITSPNVISNTVQVGGVTVIDSNRYQSNLRIPVVNISSNTTANVSTLYIANTFVILTLPSSPVAGDFVRFTNQSNVLTSNIARNGANINGLPEDLTIDAPFASLTLIYDDPQTGWVIV